MTKKDLEVFYKITNLILGKKLKFKTKLEKALKLILNHLNCICGSIMLQQGEYLEIITATDKKIEGLKVNLNDINRPSVKVFFTGKTLKVDLRKNRKNNTKYQSDIFLIVPIKTKNKTVGVINITDKVDGEDFSSHEIKLIQKFISTISVLFENLLLEESLKQKNIELEKTLKSLKEIEELREELTNMIIHDLKSPLSQVLANLDILAQEDEVYEKYFDIIDAAIKGCEDMQKMILNLLDIYKIEQGKIVLNKTYEQVNDLILEISNKLRSLIEIKNLKLYLKLSENIPEIYIDRNLIARVFYNILDNAIKYSPVEQKIYINTKVKGKFVEIEFKNTGVNIPKSDLKKIFDKFYSIYKKHESSGLGLTFCKLAIEAHEGDIIAKTSEKNNWTKFIVKLPIEEEKSLDSSILDLTL